MKKNYAIKPLGLPSYNIAYREVFAGVYDMSDVLVGYAFVQLLPGVWNKDHVNALALARNLFQELNKQ